MQGRAGAVVGPTAGHGRRPEVEQQMSLSPSRGVRPRRTVMALPSAFEVPADVQTALRERRPVVAVSSTPFAHSLPAPVNLETAREVDAVIRREGAVPA